MALKDIGEETIYVAQGEIIKHHMGPKHADGEPGVPA